MDDALLSDAALAGLQPVEPSCTLRSTQKSTVDDDDDGDLNATSECESDRASRPRTQHELFDLVSDSNDEDEDESVAIAIGGDACASESFYFEHSIADIFAEQ